MTRHLVVAGAQRCGTTYLHDMLAGHPQIAMARPARPEPKVFLSDELTGRGLDWYEQTYFAHRGDAAILGEKSTSYLEFPEAADRAAAMLGEPLVLVQLRDPIERAVSHWTFSHDAGLENRPLEEALRLNLAGPLAWDPARTSVSPFAYLERGRYADYLDPWRARFGADLRILFLEELVEQPGRIADVYAFLGVDPRPRPEGIGSAVNESGRQGAQLGDELREALEAYFAESDQRLSHAMDRPLPWQAGRRREGRT